VVSGQAQNDEVAMMIMTLIGGIPKPVEKSVQSTEQQLAAAPSAQPTIEQQTPPSPAVVDGAATAQSPVTFQTSTGNVVPPTTPPSDANVSIPIPPPAQPATPVVDNVPSGSAVSDNGSMMQPTNAYNYSGIPASSRPVNYVSPFTRQEEVE